jgi:hypothetical protein
MTRRIQFEGQVHEFPDDASDAEIQKALASSAPIKPKSASEQLGIQSQWVKAPLDFVEGAGAGLLNTVYGAGDLIRRATGSKRIINDPKTQAAIAPVDSLAGKAGYYTEKTGEFALPGAGARKGAKLAADMAPWLASKTAQMGVRSGLEGVGMGLLTKVQGADNTDTAINTGIGAVSPFIEPVIANVVKKLPPAIMNNALRPLMNQFGFGKDAGQGVVGENIIAASWPRLVDAINKAKNKVGSALSDVINFPKPLKTESGAFMMPPPDPGNVPQAILSKADVVPPRPRYGKAQEIWDFDARMGNKGIPGDPGIEPNIQFGKGSEIPDFAERLGTRPIPSGKTGPHYTRGNLNQSAVDRSLDAATRAQQIEVINKVNLINRNELMNPVDEAIARAIKYPNLVPEGLIENLAKLKQSLLDLPEWVSPSDLHDFKMALGENTIWTGTSAYEKPLNVAKARTFGRAGSAIESIRPEAEALNGRYSNLLEAGKSATRMANKIPQLRFNELAGAGIGEMVSPHAGVSLLATLLTGRSALGSTLLSQAIKHGTEPTAKTLKDIVAAWISQKSRRNEQEIQQ